MWYGASERLLPATLERGETFIILLLSHRFVNLQ